MGNGRPLVFGFALMALPVVLLGGCESTKDLLRHTDTSDVGALAAVATGRGERDAVLMGIAGNAIGYMITEATQSEREVAEAKAQTARTHVEQQDRHGGSDRLVLAKVAENEYVPVDEHGKATGQKIRMEEDPIAATGANSSPARPESSASVDEQPKVKSATADGMRIEGMKNDDGGDTFDVVFVDVDE